MKKRFFLLGMRTLFLQSLWNFGKLQNIGFMFIIMKELKRIYPDKEEYNSAIKRHFEFFNIHPYMCSILVGIIIKLEEDNKAKNINDAVMINNIKSTMAGPLSALGDSFFWGLLRPFVAVLTFILFLIYILFKNIYYEYQFDALFFVFIPIFYLFIYNSLHFFIRFYCLEQSYYIGLDILSHIKKWKDINLDRIVRRIGIFLVLFIFLLYCIYKKCKLNTIIIYCLMFLLFEFFKNKRRWSTIKIIFAVSIVLIILTFFKGGGMFYD
ncbi:MAG: PTS system mannose/fructose/sorbose family transporter subunit IID [Elusimicrobiota bacterium]|jgi:mannose/fructose/N-acetylgalactosamine-specific phosphotransferase system component IID|nr:PTS system mannose/fructose/sorbose family transporter subunit IID [Elusimicrobiota bacterium]